MDLRLEMGLKWRLTIFNKPTELGYTLVMLVEGNGQTPGMAIKSL